MGMSSNSTNKSTRSSKAAMSEINVTPFVDVMLVLLVIFMVTAPLMQQGIDVNLPKTSSTGIELNDEPLVLSIDVNGKIKIIDLNISIKDLRPKLKAIFNNKKNKQLYIQADRKVDYGIVAEAMAEARAAGILNLSLVTLPKE